MKRVRFLWFMVLLLTVVLPTQAQTMHAFSFSNEPLANALKRVGKATAYSISFVYKDVEPYRVNGSVQRKNVEGVVAFMLEGKPLRYSVEGKNIDIYKTVEPRKSLKKVAGVVTDPQGEPLVGAIVRLVGTKVETAATADVNGHFELAADEEAREVEVSYMGYITKRQRIAPGNKPLTVRLEQETNKLDEVVVTGYQTISRERTAGSFAKVTATELANKRFASMEQLLEGEIVGYNTRSGLIRGTTSMNGITQPLYVIDGFPVENVQLNLDDIESITVLKDAAATSIYGARAANGVVVVVTKKATGTQVGAKVSFTMQPYRGTQQLYTNAADMVDIEREWAAQNPNLQQSNANAYAASLLENNVYTSQGIKTLLNAYAGNITVSKAEEVLRGLAQQGYRYYNDVERAAKRMALQQQYNVNVGSASERNNFRMSFSFENNDNNDVYTTAKNFGISVRDELRLTARLSAEMGTYAYYEKQQLQTYNVLSPGFSYMPYDGLFNDDGSFYTSLATDRLSKSTLDVIRDNALYNMDITPLDELKSNFNIKHRLLSRTYAKLNVTLPLSLKYFVMFQYEYGTDRNRQLNNRNSFSVRNLVNSYATAENNGTVFNVPFGNILNRSWNTLQGYTFRQQLNFDRTFAGKHAVTALVGHEVRKNTAEFTSQTLYDYDPDVLSYTPVDQAKLSNTYGLLGGYGLTRNDFGNDTFTDNRFISLYANAAYSFDERYTATASVRWDRSNLWGTNIKYQKKPIWSVGAAWNVDREHGLLPRWVDRLKVRWSYGIAGNVAKDAAPYMTFYVNPNTHVGGYYSSVSTRPNPNLRWEKTTTNNVGVDVALFQNRINATIDLYRKYGTDLLANTMGVPTEGFGYTTYKINNGKMLNKGVEIALDGILLRKQNAELQARLTYSYNRNTVKYVNVKAPVYYLQLDYPQAYPVVGNPYNAIYAYRWAGLGTDGLPRVFDADGNAVSVNPGSLDAVVYAGNTEPTQMASLSLSARLGTFTASCLWVAQGGHKLRNSFLPMLPNGYNQGLRSYVTKIGVVNKDIVNRWKQPGDELHTNIPRNVFAEDPAFNADLYTIYANADVNVISAANLRLANVSLAWTMPRKWLSTVSVSNARLQLNIEDVFLVAPSKAAKYLLGGYEAPRYVLGFYVDF